MNLEKGLIIPMSLKSISTIIGQVERLNQIGNTLSDRGYCVPRNSNPIVLKPPKILSNAVSESTMCFLQKLKEKKYDEFLVNERTAFAHLRLINDHITHWQSIMLPADPKYIGTAIEMCASTFGCDVPNELGLSIYKKILAKYPQCIIEQYTEELIKTYKYRRLPVPADFIAIFDPPYDHGMLFIENQFNKAKSFAKEVEKCYNISTKGV